jgi:flagellar basal-body rod protein FlgF
MDRLIYIAMTGAAQNFERQAIAGHNLANASTTGYRADTAAFQVAPVLGPGLPTRAYAMQTTTGADLQPGAVQQTGRDLDVAVQGPGWIAVEGLDGQEGYTRSGSLQTSPDGTLQTRTGLTVLSDGGPISIPTESTITIGADGTVSAVQNGQGKATTTVVGRIKLVNPSEDNIVKGLDGLFRTRDGAPAPTDDKVALVSGALEGSNVNAVSAMVDMINLARQFEIQMKLLQNADTNAQHAAQLLSATS